MAGGTLVSLQYSSTQEMNGDLEGVYVNRTCWYWLCLMCPKLSPAQTKGNHSPKSRSTCDRITSCADPIGSSFHWLCLCVGSGRGQVVRRTREAAVCLSEGQVCQCLQDGAHHLLNADVLAHFQEPVTGPTKLRADSPMLCTWLDSRKLKIICQVKMMRKERPK